MLSLYDSKCLQVLQAFLAGFLKHVFSWFSIDFGEVKTLLPQLNSQPKAIIFRGILKHSLELALGRIAAVGKTKAVRIRQQRPAIENALLPTIVLQFSTLLK